MFRKRLLPHALAFAAGSAFLAACATTATGPIGPTAAAQTTIANALLYVSDAGMGSVTMYLYPQFKYEGTLSGIKYPAGLCVDPRTEDVWVVDVGARALVEFAHGKTKPVRTLKIKAYYPQPNACAVNPQNGDLAVAIMSFGSDPGALTIFKNARGKPDYYRGIVSLFYYAGYDNSGNAFADGYGNSHFQLAELTNGSKTLERVTPHGLRIGVPGGVQYDGFGVAVGDKKRSLIYEISGGSVTGKTSLTDACNIGEFFIDGGKVAVPSKCGKKGKVLVYRYPLGGFPLAELDGLKTPIAVAISR
jgi:hypothetical protein